MNGTSIPEDAIQSGDMGPPPCQVPMEAISFANQLMQYMVAGLMVGAIYAMVAIGFNIIYTVSEIINFAQGEFVVLGGLVMVSLHEAIGLPLLPAFIVTIAAVTLIGMVLERVAIRSIHKPTALALIIATVAASFIFKGSAMLIWGKSPLDLPAFSGREAINFSGVILQPQYLWVVGLLVCTVIGLTLFFNKTITGKAMNACADNPDAARLVGINSRQMVLLSFALSAAIGAAAGITITPITFMDYDRGAMLAVKGFGAAIVGGLGSFPGAVIGGLMLGLIESFGAGLFSSGYKDAYALVILLVVLIVRPSGILGNLEATRFKRY